MKVRKERKWLLLLIIIVCFGILGTRIDNVRASYTDKKIALMGIVHSDGADRTSWIAPAAIGLGMLEYTNISKHTAFTISDFLTQLNNDDMVVVHTHGLDSGDRIMAVNSGGVETWITTTLLTNALPNNALSQLRICYLGACSSGKDGAGADNMVNAVYKLGAKCVIGYSGIVFTNYNRLMLERFCIYIGNGRTVNEALKNAEIDVFNKYGAYGNIDKRYVVGVTGISMTRSSYAGIPSNSNEYELRELDGKSIYIESEDIAYTEDNEICLWNGEIYRYDKSGNVIMYISGEQNVSDKEKMVDEEAIEEFFLNFNCEDYILEVLENENKNQTYCMRRYINDIKTDDIIYYILYYFGSR